MSGEALRIYKESVAVITGGASGIGRAIAEELIKRGGEVILADLQFELAEEVAEAIRQSGGKATAYELDVSDFSAIERLIDATIKRTGRLDFMFNNAGIGVGGNFELHTIEDWDRVLDVNLKGVVYGTHAAFKIMLDQGYGHIINTSSIAGILPLVGVASYTVSKTGVVGLTKALRAEAALQNIRVSLLVPGVVRTPILEGGKYGKLYPGVTAEEQREIWESLKPIHPETFAVKALNAIAKNKAIIIIPSWWKMFWRLDRMFPLLGIRLATKKYQKGKERMS